jgi:hypothetical protein
MECIENKIGAISSTEGLASQEGRTSTYEHAITRPLSLNITCTGSLVIKQIHP